MSPDGRDVDENAFKVEIVLQGVENTLEDSRKRPRAETLEHAVPVAGTLRKVALGRFSSGQPEDGLEKPPVVRRGGTGFGRLAGNMGSISA